MKQSAVLPSGSVTRRRFLAATAAVSAFTLVPRHVLGAGEAPPSEKLNIAGIGVGGMGAATSRHLEAQNIVALCDVDHDYAAKTFKKYPQAKVWTDYREMLEKQKDIDAVVIATPDHTHAVICHGGDARRGKHVYLPEAADPRYLRGPRAGRGRPRVQASPPRWATRATPAKASGSICEWIWDGAIGEVREVDAWCDLSYYPWGHASWSSKWGARPADTPPLPDKLNWDLWLGPAPHRPYHPAYHPTVWRCWWDFGCGMMGDRGAHTLDAAVWALKLGHPTQHRGHLLRPQRRYPSRSPPWSPTSFPARDDLPPLKLTWWEGLRAPRPEDLDDDLVMHPEGGIPVQGHERQNHGRRLRPAARCSCPPLWTRNTSAPPRPSRASRAKATS